MASNYWKSKVLPKIRKAFDKNGTKKAAAAAEACKSFDDSKERYIKEFEDKKNDLQPKVVQLYEASSVEIKNLIKEPKDATLKKHSAAIQKFLDKLVKLEFPGSKPVSEACSKLGAANVSGPVFFVFEKVSTLVFTQDEEKKKEEEVAAASTEATATSQDQKPSSTGEEEVKEKEIVAGGEIKEEEKTTASEKSTETAEPVVPAALTTTTEATEVGDAPPPAAEPPKP